MTAPRLDPARPSRSHATRRSPTSRPAARSDCRGPRAPLRRRRDRSVRSAGRAVIAAHSFQTSGECRHRRLLGVTLRAHDRALANRRYTLPIFHLAWPLGREPDPRRSTVRPCPSRRASASPRRPRSILEVNGVRVAVTPDEYRCHPRGRQPTPPSSGPVNEPRRIEPPLGSSGRPVTPIHRPDRLYRERAGGGRPAGAVSIGTDPSAPQPGPGGTPPQRQGNSSRPRFRTWSTGFGTVDAPKTGVPTDLRIEANEPKQPLTERLPVLLGSPGSGRQRGPSGRRSPHSGPARRPRQGQPTT